MVLMNNRILVNTKNLIMVEKYDDSNSSCIILKYPYHYFAKSPMNDDSIIKICYDERKIRDEKFDEINKKL